VSVATKVCQLFFDPPLPLLFKGKESETGTEKNTEKTMAKEEEDRRTRQETKEEENRRARQEITTTLLHPFLLFKKIVKSTLF
jgi:hypothetical protein